MLEKLTVGRLAQIACLLEATARKPGNVHRFADFDDCGYLDFALSAQAVGPSIDRVAELGVGPTILKAVEATQNVVTTNTNLGMLLLLVPLAAVPDLEDLRQGVARVLRETTIDDAGAVYQAIRMAHAGGLGEVADQDVSKDPDVSLIAAMRMAAHRDSVALQYTNGFEQVFDVGLPGLKRALSDGQSLETAIIATHLGLLAEIPDTLIARKLGIDEARQASRMARDVLQSGWPENELGREELQRCDDWLGAKGHGRNPGTTADLVAATLFVALRDGTIPLPLSLSRWGSIDHAFSRSSDS